MPDTAQTHQCTLNKPVFFIGFMGAGKTSVARSLAKTCGLNIVDVDEYVEQQEGRSITRIFAEDGEGHFRELESQCLRELSADNPQLISCGGGVVKREANVRTMKERGLVVYLGVDAEDAAARIPNTASRPLFKDLETARAIIAERTPLYEAAADVSVNTNGKSVSEVAEEVRAILIEQGVLVQDV